MGMMKTLACLLLVMCINSTMAESSRLERLERDEIQAAFVESEMVLPPVPHVENGTWFDLYINPTFSGKPRILLDSIQTAPDGSVRYVLNNRSAVGHDNITAEGLLCTREMGLLSPAGFKIKIFGFADVVNGRWIKPRRAEWSEVAVQKGVDRVRELVFEMVCRDGRAKNDEILRQRFRDKAGRGFDYKEK